MKKLLKVITNKYFITVAVFMTWILYFDQNDWMTLRQRQRELNAVKSNIDFLNKEIDGMLVEREALLTDHRAQEKYAREHFHMKRENEDVYVITDK